MKRNYFVFAITLLGMYHTTCGQEVHTIFNLKNQMVTYDTLTTERANAQGLTLKLQQACDSLGLDIDSKAFMVAFAQIRTKNFTASCCKYNNIFKVTKAIQYDVSKISPPITFKNPQNIPNIGWSFSSIYDAVYNICTIAMFNLQKNTTAKPLSHKLQITTQDIMNALVQATQNSLTEQEVKEIKEIYPIIFEMYKIMDDPNKLKSLLNL